jgi:hypothetical protein
VESMAKDICRAYPPVPFPQRLPLVGAYMTPSAERTLEQSEMLGAEIARTGMTLKKAERIVRTWKARGFNPWSAMDIAELEMLKREYGSLEEANARLIGVEK